jgi:hypothetical protein
MFILLFRMAQDEDFHGELQRLQEAFAVKFNTCTDKGFTWEEFVYLGVSQSL